MIPDSFDAKRWVLLSGLKLAFSRVREILLINLGSGLLLGFMLRDTHTVVELVAWLGALIAIGCVSYVDTVRFISLANEQIDIERWQRRFRTGAAASGLPWGYATAVLFPTESLAHQVVIALVLAAVCAGAITAYSAVRHTYFVFLLPAVLPLFVRFVVEDNGVHYSMAIATLFFVCIAGRSSLESTRLMSDVFSAQAQNIELARSLHHRATHDSLVDLVNHGEFKRRLDTLARHSADHKEPYALLFVDLDEFKTVNDTGGHSAGDQVLQQIAAILKSCTGPHDTAARVGGDEFAILLQSCSQERAAAIAERILAAIGAFRLAWEGCTYQVGASIGIAYTYCGEYNAAATLRAADAACYAAKNAGRGCIRMYHADPLYDASGRFELTRLRAAN